MVDSLKMELLMYTLEGVSSVANFITAYEEGVDRGVGIPHFPPPLPPLPPPFPPLPSPFPPLPSPEQIIPSPNSELLISPTRYN